MEIKIADCIGFCSGVKRAIKLAGSGLKKSGKVYSLGPIIHNPQVVSALRKQGLEIVKDLDAVREGPVIIRSHGIGPASIKKARSRKLRMIDATCHFVKKSQRLVESLSRTGCKILIAGQARHPEVKALLDYAGGKAQVVAGPKDAEALNLKGLDVCVIAQTTYSRERYLDIISSLLDKGYSQLRILNTICRETIRRQDAARRLAREVDVMLIVGGRNSANTSRLAEICRERGKEVRHVEKNSEIDPDWFINKRSVGISSGASTPDWIIEQVVDKVKELSKFEKKEVIV